jgi:hypothetical protein
VRSVGTLPQSTRTHCRNCFHCGTGQRLPALTKMDDVQTGFTSYSAEQKRCYPANIVVCCGIGNMAHSMTSTVRLALTVNLDSCPKSVNINSCQLLCRFTQFTLEFHRNVSVGNPGHELQCQSKATEAPPAGNAADPDPGSLSQLFLVGQLQPSQSTHNAFKGRCVSTFIDKFLDAEIDLSSAGINNRSMGLRNSIPMSLCVAVAHPNPWWGEIRM